MELDQEEALYEFLENTIEPFTLEDITNYVKNSPDPWKYLLASVHKRNKKLPAEIAAYLNHRKIAFKLSNDQWVSRRGYFESASFVITPSRVELANGILIPGHRCIPFAHHLTLPHRYKFFWKGNPIPVTTTEAPPEDLYPYYCIYGEEFAPQYIAMDNAKNEEAFNADMYEDPPEVSIHTLDMRVIYRECNFVPGDRFVVQIIDWKESIFEIEKVDKDRWSSVDLDDWQVAAEAGFKMSFETLGPGATTEEQISFAYWYGGERMKNVPSYSLEEFLYIKTNQIETVPYGIETRFWFAGKDIPDVRGLQNPATPLDRTYIEELLYKKNIPVSEYVILSYIRDSFFRNEKDIFNVINRIVPPIVFLDKAERNIIFDYVSDNINDEINSDYSPFLDRNTGPVRNRVVELHTAVIELSTRLQRGEIEFSWLPKHTFVMLSQIQGHAAVLLEDLAFYDSHIESEINVIDNSIDSMIDTFTDIKDLINTSMDNFRRSSLTVIHGGKTSGQLWRMIQISISSLDVWRRAIVTHECTMEELNKLILVSMNWSGALRSRFYCETPDGSKEYLHDKIRLGDINFRGKLELIYEYGSKWTVKVIILSSYQPAKNDVIRFITGSGTAPPEHIEGPRHFRKLINSIETGKDSDRQTARRELGRDFNDDAFDLEKINSNLRKIFTSVHNV